jgi:hypothetical protein
MFALELVGKKLVPGCCSSVVEKSCKGQVAYDLPKSETANNQKTLE